MYNLLAHYQNLSVHLRSIQSVTQSSPSTLGVYSPSKNKEKN